MRTLALVKGTAGDGIGGHVVGKANRGEPLLLGPPDQRCGSGPRLPTRRKMRVDVEISVDRI